MIDYSRKLARLRARLNAIEPDSPGAAIERRELKASIRDTAKRQALAEFRAKAGPVRRDMLGAY